MQENTKMVYDVEDIMTLLNVGRNKAYTFVKQAYEKHSPFIVIKVGLVYKIPKDGFVKWLQNG